MPHPDVLILGGGIIGLACARELALAGVKVELLERLPAGTEASLAAAGMLSPLAEIPTPGPLFDACRESRDLWVHFAAALGQETGLSVEHDTHGAFLLAQSEDEEDWLEQVSAAARQLGEPVEEADLSFLARQVPDVSPGVRRALLLPCEHRVDNVQACAVLAAAAKGAGAVLHYGTEVERVERTPDGVRVVGQDETREAARLVVASGAWSGSIPGLPTLPVRPVRGQMLMLGGVTWPWKGIVRGRHGYTVRRGAAGLLVGATVEEAGFAAHTTVDGIESLLAFSRHALPGLGGARLEATWAGLRPGTPDELPVVGAFPGEPILAATGHYRNGILLAPWTAREIARLISSGAAVPGAFSPARFSADVETRATVR